MKGIDLLLESLIGPKGLFIDIFQLDNQVIP